MQHLPDWRRIRRPLAPAVFTIAVGLAVFACRDVSAPVSDPIAVGDRASLSFINGPGRVAVSPGNMHGWVLFDDQVGVACADMSLCNFVDGPNGSPGGSGSAELAVLGTSGGKALIIADYGGVRLDQVTSLQYSTYRQSVDNGNNLAIALQFNVDYDLTDASVAYQGRLVYEPYQVSGGQVMQSTWQSWDAKAGKWWGTKSSVVRNGQTVSNPCVQSAPCTWSQVLTLFPNVGVHSTMGAVVLKAGSGWANFRGNVDNLAIGINGATTTFDFEPRVAEVHLRTEIGPTVVSPITWPVDSAMTSGTVVNYSFSSRPGRTAPIVVLDDTIAASSGQILMNADHTLRVESDTTYSYAALRPLEKSIADLQTNLLTSSNKVVANQALINFLLAQVSNGTDPAVLERAYAVGTYIAIDPVRDAAALDQVSEALNNRNFFIDIYSDGSFGTYSDVTPVLASRSPTTTSAVPMRIPSDFRPTIARTAQRIGRKTGPVAFSRIPAPTVPSKETLVDPDDPGEYTYLVVTNGIWNSYTDAQVRTALFANLVRTQRRFSNDWTTVVLHYNRNRATEMRDWDTAHPCTPALDLVDLNSARLLAKAVQFAACQGIRFSLAVTMDDLVESWRLREAAKYNEPVSHVETKNLTDMIRVLRNQYNSHAILIQHSEGTIIGANAVRALPAAEGHPINVANRCVAVLAFAPAVPRAAFGLDDYHLKGMLAQHDILELVGVSNPAEWQTVTTVLGDSISDAMVAHPLLAPVIEHMGGFYVHQVGEYLRGPGRALFLDWLTTLHKECVAGSGTLTLTPSVVPVGSTTQLDVEVLNQNGRELLGRRINPGYNSRALERVDSATFLAYEPFEGTGQMSLNLAWNLTLRANFSIPLVSVQTNLVAKDSLWWDTVGGSNGGLGSPTPGPIPTSGSCGEVRRVPGEGTSYVDYLARCATLYHVDYSVPPTLASGLQIREGRTTWHYLDGHDAGGDDAACGDERCLESVRVELIDVFGAVVGRTVKPIP